MNGNPGWGGGEQWFLDASKALAARGHDLALSARAETRLLDEFFRAGSSAFPLEALGRGLSEARPEVVLCNSGRDLRALVKACGPDRSFPIVLRRGIDRPLRDHLFRRRSWRRLSAILVNSEATRRTVQESLPWFPADRIKRLYNPVSFAPAPRIPGPEGVFRFGAVGRLVRQKGFHLLLQAFARVSPALDCTLVIAGHGKLRPRLERLHRRLGLGERCRFLGHVLEMPAFFAGVDALIMPSLYEGFGFAAVEAALAGLPVVASEVSSLPEIVRHGETGLLVPPEDVDALAEAMKNLARRKDRGRSLGEEARQRAGERFDPEALQDDLEAFLLEAAQLPPVGRRKG